MSDLVYWIWLSLACTTGSPTFSKLLASYDNAKEIYDAGEREIRACVGWRTSDCSNLVDKDLTRAEEIYNFCTTKGVGILKYDDKDFPESLREIPTPPVLLYYRGKLPDFTRGFRCAIVGTRSLSDYGRRNAFRLGYDMACAGAIVVSGMALGIDGVAMAGALAAGGTTIAVLGSGIDVCYPHQHRTLARAIVKKGCVFTEYPPGTRPSKPNFPRRNRLISGLCPVTAVVEGRERSGALFTARHAMEQERVVYAFPGNISDPGSQVSNLLLKNGARICTGADDIVRDFEKIYPGQLNPFNLKETMPVKMFDVLRQYEVECVTPSDDIFTHSRSRSSDYRAESNNTAPETEEHPSESDETQFDAEALKIYKKIPRGEECDVEDLVDEEHDYRSVSRLLLNLEIGRFVKMIPGGRVRRIK